MESLSSQVSRKSSSSTPVKSFSPSVAAAKCAVADDILTPEKPAEVRRSLKKRGVAYSLKEVRKIATSLRQSPYVSRDRKEGSEPASTVCTTSGGVRKRLPSKAVVQLTERCEKLLEFFNSLTSSIRLLRLKGYPTYFSKISRQVESLTSRRFSHGHLAQLKYILPEAICVKKVLVHDESTSCTKPDLQIILQTDFFDDRAQEKKGNDYHKLTQIFRSRLAEFSLNEKDIPEAELPEPFNQTSLQNITPTPTPSQIQESIFSAAMSSHLPSSFTRRFSRKAQDVSSFQAKPLVSESASSAEERSPPKILSVPERTPSKNLSAPEGTPLKILSTPLKTMAATPDVETPKRFQLDRRPTRTKLFHTPVKEEEKEKKKEEEGEEESSVLKFLPKSLLQSVRAREKRAREEQEDDVAAVKRRKKMLSCLPKLFNSLRLLFQSANCSVITRQELVHRILSSQCDVLDRREVEDQLSLLLQLLPDWISAKTSSAGDSLLCINKTCDPDVIRRRLAEAE